jgi:allophanate hydrolase
VNTPHRFLPFDIASLRRAYRDRAATPSTVVASVFETLGADKTPGIWIHVREADAVMAEARELERAHPADARPPLYGIPFAVKDNIDVGGIPTTAACPDFAYTPAESAPVVERLRAAGALCIGKTNLDQFATGLAGVRSPYGIPPNPFDARYVSGGSSSGSAAAVARGHVSFALATDTAGSGRVPAAFNHLVGLKPSRGLLSTRGVLPACRSFDCVTLMALTCDDARDAAEIAAGFDAADPFARPAPAHFSWTADAPENRWRIGVPRPEDLVFGDDAARVDFDRACARLEAMGASLERVNLEPFLEAGNLLYEGAIVSERLAGLETFFRARPDSILPVIRTLLARGDQYPATEAFRSMHRLKALVRAVEPTWTRVAALVVPTTPSIPRIEELAADPIGANTRLGRYTTFGNLLDLAGVAVPSGLRPDGLPAGVTFLGPWGSDASLLAMAGAFHAREPGPLGVTGWPWPKREARTRAPRDGQMLLAVVGAHLSGQPLNGQLTQRGAALVSTTRTAPYYRLFAVPGTQPPKPGLVRSRDKVEGGVEVEVWSMPEEVFGSFIALVSAPLAIGQLELEDGSRVHGFLCEPHAVEGARDITSFGGWRAFLALGGRASAV